MKTAEEILNNYEPNREYPSYYNEFDVIQAMEEYAAQFKQSPSPSLSAEQDVEGTCQTCGGYNPVWSANNDLFNKVNGSSEGIICPTCFIKKANEIGINMFGIKQVENNPVNKAAEQEAEAYAEMVVRDYIDKGVVRGLNNIRDSSTAAYLAGKASGGDGWVRVEDGLPSNDDALCNDTVLFWSKKHGFPMIGCYDYETASWTRQPWETGHSDLKFDEVTHWRNLPTPPVK